MLNHVVESNYPLSYEFMKQASLQAKVLAYSLFTMGRLGVPLFLMISGYLLLDRTYSYKDSIKFYKNNLLGLLLTSTIWTIVYNVFVIGFYGKPFSAGLLARNIFLVKQVQMAHMWYIPMIISVYLFIPIFATLLRNLDVKMLKVPMLVGYICLFMIPVVNALHKGEPLRNLVVPFTCYPLIFLLGYAIKKELFNKYTMPSTWVIFLSGYMLTVILQLSNLRFNRVYNVWYDCGILLIAAVALFRILQYYSVKLKENNFMEQALSQLAKYAFGVYLIYMPIILIMNKYLTIYRPYKIGIIFIMTVLLSYILAMLLGRISFLRRPLLFIK